jgi:hypothetical protein
MNYNEEYLYTDYAIQLVSAFINKEPKNMPMLFETFNEELEDPAFIPGLMFGFLIHIESLFNTLGAIENVTVTEAFQKYALYYGSIREELKRIEPLNPSFAKQALKELREDLGF